MSEPENFLSRWSRRKAEAERKPDPLEPESAATVQPEAMPVPASAQDEEGTKQEEPVDLTKLPSLESIGPGTDISAFLQKGVPGDLARAALRRVWTADPAIRDFIGIAENQYDFATGSDIPGFGPLSPTDDVARMVAQITREGLPRAPSPGDENKSAENKEPLKAEEKKEEARVPEAAELESGPAAGAAEPVEVAALKPTEVVNVAPQQDEDDTAAVERSHGRALPR